MGSDEIVSEIDKFVYGRILRTRWICSILSTEIFHKNGYSPHLLLHKIRINATDRNVFREINLMSHIFFSELFTRRLTENDTKNCYIHCSIFAMNLALEKHVRLMCWYKDAEIYIVLLTAAEHLKTFYMEN